jgi:O-antigen ligase
MIPLLVFYVHVVFAAGLITKRWQEEGLSEAILALVFAGLIFFVGWSMTSFLVRLVMNGSVYLGVDQDSASLLLLTCAEALFYYYYYRNESGQH